MHNPSFSDGRVFVGTVGAYVAVDGDDGHPLWTVDLGPDDTGSARVADGRAFIGKSGDALSSHLRAMISESGTELWNAEGLFGAPTIGDGVGYSGGPGRLTAFDLRTGAQRWDATFDGGLGGPVLADGVLYVLLDRQPMSYALDAATGGELWRFDVDGGVTGMSLAGGLLFEATDTGLLYAIGGDGTKLTPGPIPAVTPAPAPSAAHPGASPVSSTPTAKFSWEAVAPRHPSCRPTSRWLPTGCCGSRTPERSVRDLHPGRRVHRVLGRVRQRRRRVRVPALQRGLVRRRRVRTRWLVLHHGCRQPPDSAFRQGAELPDELGVVRLGGRATSAADGIATAPDGTVLILDEGRGVVERYDSDGTELGAIDPFQGKHRHGFNTAGALSADQYGNVYVSMFDPNQVVRLDPAGKITQVFGGEFLDQAGYPSADAEGHLFVSQGPMRGDAPGVLVFDSDGSYLGGWGPEGSGEGALGFPTGVLVDVDGNVYVGDAAGSPEFPGRPRIQKFHVDLAP